MSVHYELHSITVTFYPVGTQIQYSALLDEHIFPLNWEDMIEPYPEKVDDDPEVTIQQELVAVQVDFLGEGIHDVQGFLRYEFESVGWDALGDLSRVVEAGKSVRERLAQKDESYNLDIIHTCTFLGMWKVTIRPYGDDMDYSVKFMEAVPYWELVELARAMLPEKKVQS